MKIRKIENKMEKRKEIIERTWREGRNEIETKWKERKDGKSRNSIEARFFF